MAPTLSRASTLLLPGAAGILLDISGLVAGFTGVPGSLTLASLQAGGFIGFAGANGNADTVISFDSNGSAAGGSTGTLVTLTGVVFTNSATSVSDLADNVVV